MTPIEADGLAFSYGEKPVLTDCSFLLEPGSFCALAGPNGAGKSTLFALLTGCLPRAAGELRVLGRAIEDWPPRELARALAVLPQADLAPPGMTALQMALLGRSPFLEGFFRFESARDRDLAMEALDRVGVAPLAHRPLTALSGGERRLVLLARALAQQPRLLLLDEPAASLDLHHQQHIFRLLRALHSEGLTILCVTHDLNLASVYADRMMLLHEGRMAAQGAPAELLREEVLRPIYQADLWFEHRPGAAPAVGLLP